MLQKKFAAAFIINEVNMADNKRKLREVCLDLRNGLQNDIKADMDKRILKNIISTDWYKRSKIILMYYPFRGEIDILPLLEKIKADKKLSAFPVCDGNGNMMHFRFVTDLCQMREGKYGIMEPDESCGKLNVYSSDSVLALVPALAYDVHGNRLGYGGGYYDRFLKSNRVFSLGIVYSRLVYDEIEKSYYDFPVDAVITEKGSISLVKR